MRRTTSGPRKKRLKYRANILGKKGGQTGRHPRSFLRFCVSERTEAEADAAPVSKMQIPSMDGSGNPQPLLHYRITAFTAFTVITAPLPQCLTIILPPSPSPRPLDEGKRKKNCTIPPDLITPPQSRKAWNQNPNRPSLLLNFSSSSVPADTFFSLSPPPSRLPACSRSGNPNRSP